MTTSRRTFITTVGLAAVWSALPKTGVGILADGTPAFAGPRSPLDLATVTADTFRPHVGSRFRLKQAGQKALDLDLVRVESRPRDGGLTESFSLLFRATNPVGLAQAIHQFDHNSLGPFRIFVVPVGPRDVEAVINHLLR